MGNRGFAWIMLEFPSREKKQSFMVALMDARKYQEERQKKLEQLRKTDKAAYLALLTGKNNLGGDDIEKKGERSNHPASELISSLVSSWNFAIVSYTTEDEFARNPYVILDDERHPMAIAAPPCRLYRAPWGNSSSSKISCY